MERNTRLTYIWPTAKKKRAPWDLKGRLQDMEELVKCSTAERENLLAKFNDYDSRIQSLEEEKQNLNQNLQQSHSTTQANQEQIDSLNAKLKYVTPQIYVPLSVIKLNFPSSSRFFFRDKFWNVLSDF